MTLKRPRAATPLGRSSSVDPTNCMIEDEDQDVPGALDAVSEVLRDLACSGLFDPQVFTLKDAQATSIHLAQVLKEGHTLRVVMIVGDMWSHH